MNTYYLIRHGLKTSQAGDPDLTKEGRIQAEKTAKYLQAIGVSKIISSTYKRTLETANIIDHVLCVGIEQDDMLRERMDWGSARCQTLEDFLKEWEYSDLNRHFKPKAGKSSFEAGGEVLGLLKKISKNLITNNNNIAIITHGGVVIDLLRNLFPDSEIEKRKPGIINGKVEECSITVLEQKGDTFILKSLASTEHLVDKL